MNPIVDCSSHERRIVRCGEARRVNAMRRNLRPRFGDQTYSPLWLASIEGAGGECAVSIWTGLPWTAEFDLVPPFPGPDVGQDIEVRQSRGYALRVDRRDFAKSVGRRFVLVVGELPTYELVGWLTLPPTPEQFEQWRTPYPERVTWEIPVDSDLLLPMSSFVRGVSDAA